MSRCAPLLLLFVAGSAAGGVVVGSGVPFSAGELDDALVAREARADIEVRALAAGQVEVTAGVDRWAVDLGDARGRTAARLVALHVAERGPSTVAPMSDGSVAAGGGGARVRLDDVTVRAGLGRGVGADDLSAALLAFDLAGGAGPLWWSVQTGGQRSFTRDPEVGMAVGATRYRGAALVGVRTGPLTVGAGVLVSRLWVADTALAEPWSIGAAGSATWAWPLDGGWAITTGLDASWYQHRVDVRYRGATVATTPGLALDLSLGLRRELAL